MNNQALIENQPRFEGNILVLPILSSRNKKTGKYQLSTDGNVNSMLHLFSINSEKIKSITMILPQKELMDTDSILDYDNIFKTYRKFKHIELILVFDDSITRNYHKEDTLETRNNVNLMIKHGLHLFNFTSDSKKFDTIISEFPFDFSKDKTRLKNDVKIIYNINWSKTEFEFVEKSDLDDTLTISFYNEIERIKETENNLNIYFYVYSQIQYDAYSKYLRDEVRLNNLELLGLYIKIKIYDQDLISFVANTEALKISQNDMSFIDKIFSLKIPVSLLAFRLNDERYNLKQVIRDFNLSILILTNPTNTVLDNDISLELINTKHTDFYNVSLDNKRAVYFYILLKLRSSDSIPHYEPDMHMSTIEQYVLAKDSLYLNNPKVQKQDIIKLLNI